MRRARAVTSAQPTVRDCERLEEITARHIAGGVARMAGRPGNPHRAEILPWPSGLAFIYGKWPGALELNHVDCFRRDWPENLDAILQRIGDRSAGRFVRVPEPLMTAEGAEALKRAGMTLGSVQMWNWCVPPGARLAPETTDIEIRPVETRDDQDLYTELFLEGTLGSRRKRGEACAGQPEWEEFREFHCNSGRTLFLALIGGEPAGQAGMSSDGKTAFLGPGSTLERFRRRGIHNALLQVRLQHAAELGCGLAACGADPDTVSLRNQRRNGLEHAYRRLTFVSSQQSPAAEK